MVKKSEYTCVKNLKSFCFYDIIVYAITLLSIFFLFLFFVILPKENSVEGFLVTVDGQRVVHYDLNTKIITTDVVDGVLVDIDTVENGYIITVSFESEHYNKIFFNISDNSAKVIESNCSSSKDCTFSPAITSNGTIYCAPHRLKVLPITADGFSEPITG